MDTSPSLPDGVPELPAGRFYRIQEDTLFPSPVLVVQVRQRRKRWGSYRVADAIVDPADFDSVDRAVTRACTVAAERAARFDRRAGVYAGMLKYIGDFETNGGAE